MSREQTKLDKINERIENGKIIEQKSWKFIKELNSYSEERLNSIALIECGNEITYRQMFRKWERYAEVFSALEMTGKNQTRVGLIAETAASSVYSLYGLNMVGASVSMINPTDLMDEKGLRKTIEKEALTDLILSDLYIMPDLLLRLTKRKEGLGLRHIIMIHVPAEGEFIPRVILEFAKRIRPFQRRVEGVLFMEDLLDRYEATPFSQVTRSEEAAIILHTSGTTSGIHKPVPMSDRGFNEASARILRDERFVSYNGTAISALAVGMTSAYGLCDQMHLPLAFGGTVLLLPFGGYNPKFYRFLEEYQANLMFTGNYLMTTLPKDPRKAPDLSSLTGIYVGGNSISTDVKNKFDAKLGEFGVTVKSAVGYGLSELGGACILSTPDCEDGSIGYPLPGVKVKIFDKEENAFFDLADGPHIGEMYLSSPSVSSGRIDDQVFFELEEIDGEKYYNTNDLVSVGEDGRLFYLGRTDKYFVNNEGVRFDAGLVETAVGSEPGVVACGLAPEMNKVIHDTIPVLYIQTEDNNRNALKVVHKALVDVFVRDDLIAKSNLPSQVVVADELPFTAAGKINTQEIIQGHVSGKRYMVKSVHLQGKLKEIQLFPVKDKAANQRAIGMPEEMKTFKMLTGSNPFFKKMSSAAQRWQPGGSHDAESEDAYAEDESQNTDREQSTGFDRYIAYKTRVWKKRLDTTAAFLQKMSDNLGSPADTCGGDGDEDSGESNNDSATDPRTKKQQRRMQRGADLMAKLFNASTEDSFYED